jgi:4-amino-4-deoxy-L-arabinose transferase-like glycosyltransferase
LRRPVPIAVGLCLLLGLVLALSARHLSPTFDEGDHLLAGYRYWTCGDFGVNPEHPPFAKLLAAAPLLLEKPATPSVPCGESKTTTAEDFALGSEFLSQKRGDHLLFEARMAVASVSLLAASVVLLWARRLGGWNAGLLSLGLFVFEPTVIAHSALVTTDMAVTCFVLAAIAAWERALEDFSPGFLLLCGLATGLALASKHSGILVLPLLLGLTPFLAPRKLLPAAGALLFVFVLAVLVLWAAYGFRFDPRGGGHRMSVTLDGYVEKASRMSGVHPKALGLVEALDRAHALPESYLYGTANVLIGSASGGHMFLFGRLYPTGRWFYFPAALAVKWTLGFIGALLLALSGLKRHLRTSVPRVALLLLPPVLVLLASMTSHMNIGVRHLLPAFPFLCIFLGLECASRLEERRGVVLVSGLLALHAFSSLWAFPDFLAYSNEVFGGPKKTYRVLSDSNVDWGQGLKEATRYLEGEGTRECMIAYFGTVDPSHYGIPCLNLPGSPNRPSPLVPPTVDGTVLVSAGLLAGIAYGPDDLNPFQPFANARPVASIGGSILVFKGRFSVDLLSSLGHQERSRALLDAGRIPEALTESRMGVFLAPENPFARRALARALLKAGMREEARVEFQAALALAREKGPEFHPRLLLSLEEESSERSPEGEDQSIRGAGPS